MKNSKTLLAMLHLRRDLFRTLWLQKRDKKQVPGSTLSSPSLITGEVSVMVTMTLGSLGVTIFKAASSYTVFTSYFSSVTFYKRNKITISYLHSVFPFYGQQQYYFSKVWSSGVFTQSGISNVRRHNIPCSIFLIFLIVTEGWYWLIFKDIDIFGGQFFSSNYHTLNLLSLFWG